MVASVKFQTVPNSPPSGPQNVCSSPTSSAGIPEIEFDVESSGYVKVSPDDPAWEFLKHVKKHVEHGAHLAAACDKGIQANPYSPLRPLFLRWRAHGKIMVGELENALADLNEALFWVTKSGEKRLEYHKDLYDKVSLSELYFLRAPTRCLDNDFTGALADAETYEELMGLCSNKVRAHIAGLKGWILFRMGDQEEAFAYTDKAREMSETGASLWRAAIKYDEGTADKALQILNEHKPTIPHSIAKRIRQIVEQTLGITSTPGLTRVVTFVESAIESGTYTRVAPQAATSAPHSGSSSSSSSSILASTPPSGAAGIFSGFGGGSHPQLTPTSELLGTSPSRSFTSSCPSTSPSEDPTSLELLPMSRVVDTSGCIMGDFAPLRGLLQNVDSMSFEKAFENIGLNIGAELIPDIRMYASQRLTKFRSPLNLEEACAVSAYTLEWATKSSDSLYYQLNKALWFSERHRSSLLQPFCPYLKCLLRALPKLPNVRSSEGLWRGISANWEPFFSAKLRDQEIVTLPGITSMSDNVSEVVRLLHVKKGAEGGTLLHITTDKAVDISPYSFFPKENEVILPPCSRFQVIAVNPTDENGLTVVQLAHVSNEPL